MEERTVISRRTPQGMLELGLTGNAAEPFFARLGNRTITAKALQTVGEYAASPYAEKGVLEAVREKRASHILSGRVLILPEEAEILTGALHTSLERFLPGLEKLRNAYRERAELQNALMAAADWERPCPARVLEAEKEAERLEQEYPKARWYLTWSRMSPRTPAGKAAARAAAALLEGLELEAARKISENYQPEAADQAGR